MGSHMWIHIFKRLILHHFMLILHELTLSYSQWSQARRRLIAIACKICFIICTGIVPEYQEELKFTGKHHLLVYINDVTLVHENIHTISKTQKQKISVSSCLIIILQRQKSNENFWNVANFKYFKIPYLSECKTTLTKMIGQN